MIKTIKTSKPTKHHHPAVGRVFEVTFTDNTVSYLYEETYLHQIGENYTVDLNLEGFRINLEEAFLYN